MLRIAMNRWQAILVCSMACATLSLHSDVSSVPARTRMSALPRHTLWTWERREDLSAIDPTTTAGPGYFIAEKVVAFRYLTRE